MKKSHVNGAVISSEYVAEVLEIMDEASGIARRSGMCDIVFRKGEKLEGDVYSMRVLTEFLKDMRIRRVAIIGTNHYAKAFSFLACGFEVSYFNENLEELMAFTKEVELREIEGRIFFCEDPEGYIGFLESFRLLFQCLLILPQSLLHTFAILYL